MSLAIVGLGTALPPTSVSAAESVQVARKICRPRPDEADHLPNLYRQSGISRRHLAFAPEIVSDILEGTEYSGSVFLPSGDRELGPTTAERMAHYDREAGPLALRAAREALERSGLRPKQVTHLITISCTGFNAPGVDVELAKQLGLAETVERTHIGFMGCHGAFNGLRVARAFAHSNPRARILLCAVELCGIHYYYRWDPKRMVANALFADGAAAMVGIPAGLAPTHSWQAAASGSCLFQDSEYAMTWSVGDNGFEMTLATKVPDLIVANLRPWLAGWLKEQGLGLGEVASWAVHPGGPRILTAVEEALGLPQGATAASREILAACGTMSSPTILFILDLLQQRGAPCPCVALGFGPGLTAEAALFRNI
jgi:predicted naringenin-chalcone synthase